jgi:hypothetical protein
MRPALWTCRTGDGATGPWFALYCGEQLVRFVPTEAEGQRLAADMTADELRAWAFAADEVDPELRFGMVVR